MRRIYIVSILVIAIVTALLFMNRNTTGSGTITLVNEPDPVKEIPPAITRYLNFLEAELDSTNNVGAALTIVVRDEVLVTRTYGLRKSDEVAKINEHTVFRLASVSKGFAGVLACILEQDSVFSLQDKVLTYLPGFRLKDSVNTLDLTIKNTLSHTSGLVPHAFDNLIEDGVPLNVIIQQLPFADISAPPGLLYGYQNVIFSLVDTIIRNRTEKSYAEILHEKIFDPLDMQDASATPQVFERKRSNIAYPHAYSGDGYKPLALNLGYYNIAPAAGVNASVSDLGKWLLALLGNRTDILDSTILGKITDPVVNSPLKLRYIRNWDKIDQKFYSLGWRIYMYKGYKIIYHGGYVSGYRAEIAFCPEAGIGMAFVQNSPNRVASMCVPVFFNTWFAVGDSLSPDTGKDTIPPEYKFFDDTLY